MKKRNWRLALLPILIVIGFTATYLVAPAGAHDRKGDHHTTATDTVTVTSTVAVAPPQVVTVTVPGPVQTVTAPAAPSLVVTKYVTVVKKVRRYCTRGRHGWTCHPWPPG